MEGTGRVASEPWRLGRAGASGGGGKGGLGQGEVRHRPRRAGARGDTVDSLCLAVGRDCGSCAHPHTPGIESPTGPRSPTPLPSEEGAHFDPATNKDLHGECARGAAARAPP